jgi:DNA polymerase-3 subunit delta
MDRAVSTILSSGSFPPILLVFGDEELLVDEAARLLYDAAASADLTGMNSDVLDGETTSLEAVLSIARSFPLMSDRRVVWVRRADKMSVPRSKKGPDLMANYLADPAESTFLLLTASIPARGRSKSKKAGLKYPFDLIVERSAFIEYPAMKEPQVVAWVTDRARSFGLTLPDGASEFLVAQTGTSLRDVAMELDKLRTYLGDRTDVSKDDIIAIIGGSREYNIYELQNAIGRGEGSRAYTIMTKMLETNAQPLGIVTMLTRYFMVLFRLIDLRQTPPTDAARAAGIEPYRLGEYLTALDRLGPGRVERALMALRTAEATMKSSSVDTTTVMQSMLASIFAVA